MAKNNHVWQLQTPTARDAPLTIKLVKKSVVVLILCALLAGGCGGLFVGSDGGGSGGGGTSITLATKIAAADQVVAYAKTLAGTPTPALMAAVATKMRTMAAFKDVNATDGGVGAHFQDGEPYAFVDNRGADGTHPTPGRLHRALKGEIPSGKTTGIFTCMGTVFTDVTPYLNEWMKAGGYLPGPGSFTVAGLITACASNEVLFLDCHGSYEAGEYMMWTADKVGDPAADAANKRYMDDKTIAFFDASFDTTPGGGHTTERHYAIKTAFVKKYLTFKKDSMLMNNGCYGAADPAFIAALKAKQLSVYMAWTLPAFDDSSALAAYGIFDQLLGTAFNGNDKADPNQRPFDIDLVHDDLTQRGYLRDLKNGTVLKLFHLAGDFGLLRPSIKYMTVKGYERELWLTGDFGSRPGKVTINDQPVALKGSWSPTLVKVDLPDSGPASAGPVVVEVSGHKSTPVPLSHWEGDVYYEDKHTAPSDTVDIVVRWHISLRADVHDYREKPRFEPHAVPVSSTCDRTSFCHWTCTGAQGSSAWSGTGDPAQSAPGPNSSGHMFQVAYTIDPETKKLKLGLIAVDKQTITTGSQTLDLPINVQVFSERPGPFALPTIDIDLANDFSIPSGHLGYSPGAGASVYTLDWSAMKTGFPPLDSTPR